MPKTLFEEAIADARQLKDLAERNAQRAVIDSVTPKIKELFEKQLLGESFDEEEEEPLDELGGIGGALGVTHPSLSSDTPSDDSSESEPVEETDECDDDMLEVTNETAAKLGMLNHNVQDRLEVNVYRINEMTNKLVSADVKTRSSEDYSRKIVETIQKIEDIYSYLQESGDSTRKVELEKKLESCFEVLNAVKESTMRMKDFLSKENLIEDLDMDAAGMPADPAAGAVPGAEAAPGGKELVMKVTGLPDDVELDKLNIDLISDEEGAEPPMDDGTGTPDLDAGAAASPGAMESDMAFESDSEETADDLSELDEDEVVEISETMLKRELARLRGKNISEMDSSVLDDFGGGSEEGDPWLDGEVSTADKDNMVKQGDSMGAKTGGKKALAAVKKAIAEKKARDKKVLESAKKSGSKQLAEQQAAVKSLRNQLTETNLFNAKLLHANKLLQLEGLTAHAKSVIIDKLDEAQNLREVKLVYEGLVRLINGNKKKTVAEGAQQRTVIAGSSSRPVSSSATKASGDGYETDRWAQLAGIRKK